MRVVIVDDSPRVVAGIGLFLNSQPAIAVVAAANSGQDAVLQVAWHEPDLVVMDVHLRGMDGREAARLIRCCHRRVRIIMMSVDQDDGLRDECLRLGADLFLPKIGLQRRILDEIDRLFPGRLTSNVADHDQNLFPHENTFPSSGARRGQSARSRAFAAGPCRVAVGQ